MHLVGCFQVAKGALNCIARGKFHATLRDLSLGGCPKLDEEAFVKMVHKCPSLEAVSLAHCGEEPGPQTHFRAPRRREEEGEENVLPERPSAFFVCLCVCVCPTPLPKPLD